MSIKTKGRTINRKVIGGGGGLFQLVRIFFLDVLLASIIFLNMIHESPGNEVDMIPNLARIFFISTYNFPY
jgi:hypothetical protein